MDQTRDLVMNVHYKTGYYDRESDLGYWYEAFVACLMIGLDSRITGDTDIPGIFGLREHLRSGALGNLVLDTLIFNREPPTPGISGCCMSPLNMV
jgi:hypothetical protein